MDNSFFKEEVDHIVSMPNNILKIIKYSGDEILTKWEDPKRSDGWTPEKREKARVKSSQRIQKRGVDGKWEK